MRKAILFIVSFIIILNILLIPSFAEESTIANVTTKVDPATGRVIVEGTISSGSGKFVTLMVKDPEGDPDYFGQTTSIAGGKFSFSFMPSEQLEGDYTVIIGGQGINTLYQTTLRYTKPPVEKTAQEVADSITTIEAPVKDATMLVLPTVPEGFTVAIKTSSNPGVIALDGTITPPDTDTIVTLTLEVTRISDGSKAVTGNINITVPAKSQANIVSIQPINVSTVAGTAPVLPTKVTAVYSDGSSRQVDVTWDSIQPTQYAQAGTFEVEGTVAGTTIKAKAVVTVSSGGSYSGDGGGTVVTPTKPEIKVGTDGTVAIVDTKPVVSSDKKTVTSTVDKDTIEKAFDKAKENADGTKKITLEVSKVDRAKQYTLELPADILTSQRGDKKLEIKTPVGTLIASSNMFNASDLKGEKNIQLNIGIADKTTIDESIKAQIGDKPVIELSAKTGNRTVEWNNPNAPVTVEIDYTPTAEELKDPEHIVVWYIDDTGKVIPVPTGKYDPKTKKVTFTTTHFSKYAVAFVKKTFDDISNFAWAKKEIGVMASKGVINGTSATTYHPEKNITRADFMKLLVRSLGLTAKVDANFSDVASTAYYYEELGIAKKLGIATGVGENKFNPNEQISRQDMMVMVYRALKAAKKISATGTTSDMSTYKDAASVSDYAVEGVAALIKDGIIKGSDNMINPLGTATRAETAVIIYRIYNK